MSSRLIRRAAFSVLSLLCVSLLVFLLLAAAPGDAATLVREETGAAGGSDSVRAEFGLTGSVWSQYLAFVGRVVAHGDFGRSFFSNRPVTAEIADRLPYTVLLAVLGMALALLLGIACGTIAALHRGSWVDITLMSLSMVGLSVPQFWLALLLILVFALWLGWVPVNGAGDWRNLILPVTCLGVPSAAVYARLVRANVLDTLHADYVLVARAKGLPPRLVVVRHVLRNSLIPTVTVAGLHFGHLLGGTVVIETIFGWPGVGRLAVEAIFRRDRPVIVGTALCLAVAYVAINFLVDVLYSVLDPRVGQSAV